MAGIYGIVAIAALVLIIPNSIKTKVKLLIIEEGNETTEQHSNVVIRYIFLTIGLLVCSWYSGYRITTIANSTFYAYLILFRS